MEGFHHVYLSNGQAFTDVTFSILGIFYLRLFPILDTLLS
jgi:hypothetical protein